VTTAAVTAEPITMIVYGNFWPLRPQV